MINNKKHKVIIAMSGGVDSSVSAWLLKKQNYQVEGLFMKNWEEENKKDFCSSEKDIKDAQKICDQIGIPLHKINFSIEYWNKVFSYFLSELKYGRTPNPDVICNTKIKFKTFLNYAINMLDADFIATGHYVRKKNISGSMHILKGTDRNKDQSYFLHALTSQQIQQSIFPLGTFKKSLVRKIAHQLQFSVANKKSSTGICFIGNKNFKKFISRYFIKQPGRILTITGKKIGIHYGLMYYTLGQRKGLNIGGIQNNKNNLPWYVIDKNIRDNTLIVAQGIDNPYLKSIGLIATNVVWSNKKLMKENFFCSIKTRYRQQDIPCFVSIIKKNTVKVIFTNCISAVTPGQFAVFYKSEVCIGGGIIKNRIPLDSNLIPE